jgi:hypothetical protein
VVTQRYAEASKLPVIVARRHVPTAGHGSRSVYSGEATAGGLFCPGSSCHLKGLVTCITANSMLKFIWCLKYYSVQVFLSNVFLVVCLISR